MILGRRSSVHSMYGYLRSYAVLRPFPPYMFRFGAKIMLGKYRLCQVSPSGLDCPPANLPSCASCCSNAHSVCDILQKCNVLLPDSSASFSSVDASINCSTKAVRTCKQTTRAFHVPRVQSLDSLQQVKLCETTAGWMLQVARG